MYVWMFFYINFFLFYITGALNDVFSLSERHSGQTNSVFTIISLGSFPSSSKQAQWRLHRWVSLSPCETTSLSLLWSPRSQQEFPFMLHPKLWPYRPPFSLIRPFPLHPHMSPTALFINLSWPCACQCRPAIALGLGQWKIPRSYLTNPWMYWTDCSVRPYISPGLFLSFLTLNSSSYPGHTRSSWFYWCFS